MATNDEPLGKKLNVLVEGGRFSEALQLIERQPEEIRSEPSIRFCRADCYYELGYILQAAEIYESLMRDPNERRKKFAAYNYALSLRELKRYDAARHVLCALDLDFLKVRSLLGEMLYYTAAEDRSVYEEAVVLLKKWLEMNPDDGLSRYILAACFNHLDKHEAALAHFKECIQRGYMPKSVLRGIIVELDFLDGERELEEFIANTLNERNDPDGVLVNEAKKVLADIRAEQNK